MFLNIPFETFIPNSIIFKFILKIFKKWGVQILITVITVILLIVFLITGTTITNGQEIGFTALPPELKSYMETGFINTQIPQKSPLGGIGMEYTTVTALYHDPDYFKEFGFEHNGIDLIPNENYYRNSKAYKLLGDIVIIATLSGKACSSGNIESGFRTEIYSVDNLYYTTYLHDKFNFIPLNTCKSITAGEPIGIMGSTGFATGAHIHYMVHIKNEAGEWKDINPIKFLALNN